MRTAIALVTLVVASLVAACVGAPGSTPAAETISTTTAATAAPTTTPASTTILPTATPTSRATLRPAATPVASALPSADSTPPAQNGPPPDLFVVLSNGSGVAGQLGSHCWGRGCGDGPAPPAAKLPGFALSGAGAGIEIAIEGEVGFVHWSASHFEDGSDNAIIRGSGGTRPDPDVAGGEPPIVLFGASFPGPPSGDWILAFALSYHGGGDAIYYWHVTVP